MAPKAAEPPPVEVLRNAQIGVSRSAYGPRLIHTWVPIRVIEATLRIVVCDLFVL